MAKLIYSAITPLDGYVEDADGNFAWGAPDVSSVCNVRPVAAAVVMIGR